MSLWDAIQGAGAVAGGLAYADLISDRGQQYAGQMGDLAAQLQSDSAFKGYGVTTGLGSSTVGADGSVTLGVGPDEAMMSGGQGGMTAGMGSLGSAGQMAQQGATNQFSPQAMAAMMGAQQGLGANQAGNFGAASQFTQRALQDTAGREQDIYNRAMAMQQPGLDAARAQSNAQEYASGRGGVMGSQFGGTGEDAAMARAQAQAQNAAAFQAMQQAGQEQMNQASMAGQFGQLGQGAAGLQSQIGQGMGALGAQNAQLMQGAGGLMANIGGQQGQLGNMMYQSSFTPMQQQLNAMQVGQGNAAMAQTGQLTGTGYGAQLGLGGIQTAVNADKAASEMYGNIIAAMMNNANAGEGESSWLGGLFGSGGLFG